MVVDTGLVMLVQWPRYGFTGFFYGLTKAANRCNDGDDDDESGDEATTEVDPSRRQRKGMPDILSILETRFEVKY